MKKYGDFEVHHMSHEEFHPHIPATAHVREFTPRATILGLIFGLFFAIANGYLALKIGQTVSASIPAAIMAMAIFKVFTKKATVLESNIVQTMATMGESLAAGVIFTIPALILLGDLPSIGKIFILSTLGGILGILFMIPMRRYIIVQEHKKLPFPEGTACASIIKAGESSRKSAVMAGWGVLVAAVYKICSNALFLWKEQPSWTLNFFRRAEFSIDATPALLGVGYIVGFRVCAYMFAGGVLSWFVIIPLIIQFGTGDSIIFPSTKVISAMTATEVWKNYVRYIGAGCIAIGGIVGLFQVVPIVFRSIHMSVKTLFGGFQEKAHVARTDKDISMTWLLIGSLAIILFLWLFPPLSLNLLTIVLLVILTFFFVAVTSFTVGLVGSTSNPMSGMTITVLLVTCIIFASLGWTERIFLIAAITMGCVVACAIALAGSTAQDLKAGYLLGSTPRSQQIAEMIGVILPSLALGYVIYILNGAYKIGSDLMPAPQATLMSMVVKGVISGDLPYILVGIGVFLGFVMLILEIPILPFALGVYLPLSLTSAIIVGGLVRLYVDRKTADVLLHEKGLLFASGLIGGDACIGIALAFAALSGIIPADAPGKLPDWISLAAYLFMAVGLASVVSCKKRH